MPPVPLRVRVLVIGLFATHAAILFDCSRRDFVTYVEPGNVAAGISYWETGYFGLYRVNPPLPKMLAVLPVLLSQPNTERTRVVYDDPGARREFVVGSQFAEANAGRYHCLIGLARLAGIGWSLLGGWVIYCWARELYGCAGGCLALSLWCFEPNVLAHAHLVTCDIPASVASLTATYVFWHYLRAPSWFAASFAGFLLGVAQLTKFTLLILYGIWPLLWAIHLLQRDRSRHRLGLRTKLLHAVWIVCLSVLVINMGYEFNGTCRFLGDYPFVSQTLAGELLPDNEAGWPARSGNRFRETWLAYTIVPVPADYLQGIDVQRRDFERYERSGYFYLAGEWKQGGWWYYYLYALVVKVPLGGWALALAGLVGTVFRLCDHACRASEATLWVPALCILAFVSSQTGLNKHLRYVLPFLPFVIVSTGKLGRFLQRDQWKAGVLVFASLLGGIVSSLAVHPHYLSYFNEAAGGPENGHNHLVASNIDWGQDLLVLKEWLGKHPEARPLGLAYWNSVDPTMIGIEATWPPAGPIGNLPDDPGARQQMGPRPGYYAVSINFLRDRQCTYSYFLRFRPVAMAGYSIYIYHISLEEANRIRGELGLEKLSSP